MKEMNKTFYIQTSKNDILAYFEQPVELYLCSGATALGFVEVDMKEILKLFLENKSEKAFAKTLALNLLEKAPIHLKHVSMSVSVCIESSDPLMEEKKENQDQEKQEQKLLSPVTVAPIQISPIRSSNECETIVMDSSTMSNYTMSMKEKEIENDKRQRQEEDEDEEEKVQEQERKILSFGSDYAKLYKIEIEITSLKGLHPSHVLKSLMSESEDLSNFLSNASHSETWLYARFEYPLLFGTTHVYTNACCYVKKVGRSMTIVEKPEMGGSLFSFEFAMTEKNLHVALKDTCVGVEIWRMAKNPRSPSEASRKASNEEADELVGIALVPLSAIVSNHASRVSIGDGEISFSVHDYYAIHPEEEDEEQQHVTQPSVGHVAVRMQLNDLGAYETSKTRDRQLREQLETTRAKLEELWEECQKARKRADKMETRLLVAEFEEQVREGQDREDYQKARQVQVEKLKQTESNLKKTRDKLRNQVRQHCVHLNRKYSHFFLGSYQ